jgi:hypothetical protein
MEGTKIARLWKRKTKDGKVYLEGAMTSMTRLVVIENDRKTDERQPDFYAYVVPNRGPRPLELDDDDR